MSATTTDNFFAKRYTTSTGFLVAILLFLLPFVEIKCNNMPFAENTGIGLAFGTDYNVSGQMKSLQDGFSNLGGKENVKKSKEKGKMYPVALTALLLGVAGLILSVANTKNSSAIQMVIGGLAAILLIVLMMQLNADVKDKQKTAATESDTAETIKVTVDFTLWYYLSVCSFLAAAFFAFKKRQLGMVHEYPPKHAPQIHVENPGDQSEFPKSASESNIG